MGKRIHFILLSLIFFAAANAEARPISYGGGWSIMQMNDEEMNAFHMFYSPTAEYSVGYNGTWWREDKYQSHSFQVNNLLKRWNNHDSQANIYWQNAAGVAYDTSGDRSDNTQPHAMTTFSIDWEDRRFFTKYEAEYHYSGSFGQEFSENVKLGVAPYLGEYGDLHTWLMVKVTHEPEAERNFYVTPIVRFFKGEYLLEVGYSENKEALVNFEMFF